MSLYDVTRPQWLRSCDDIFNFLLKCDHSKYFNNVRVARFVFIMHLTQSSFRTVEKILALCVLSYFHTVFNGMTVIQFTAMTIAL